MQCFVFKKHTVTFETVAKQLHLWLNVQSTCRFWITLDFLRAEASSLLARFAVSFLTYWLFPELPAKHCSPIMLFVLILLFNSNCHGKFWVLNSSLTFFKMKLKVNHFLDYLWVKFVENVMMMIWGKPLTLSEASWMLFLGWVWWDGWPGKMACAVKAFPFADYFMHSGMVDFKYLENGFKSLFRR